MKNIHYITPAVTPMTPDGQPDLPSCRRLYDHLIEGGVDGILILGSIGEFFGFTMAQKQQLIAFAAEAIHGRVELIVGTTSLVMDEIVALSNFALEAGANAVMVIPPYYFHFTDESVFSYYDQLAQAIQGDLFLYNFPDRTGYDISPAVMRDLARKHKNIIGVKDTLGGVDHTREVIKQVRPVRPDFRVYSGFDDNFAHNVLCGGNGCIAGLSNLYPSLTSAWVQAMKDGDLAQTQQIQQKIDRLMDLYGVGKPFVPFIKEALAQLGVIDCAAATPPMPAATEEQKRKLREIMRSAEA